MHDFPVFDYLRKGKPIIEAIETSLALIIDQGNKQLQHGQEEYDALKAWYNTEFKSGVTVFESENQGDDSTTWKEVNKEQKWSTVPNKEYKYLVVTEGKRRPSGVLSVGFRRP
eukprot:GHVU01222797.1.p1 GENE.GHVU01222797.1~~GHVU01222797.1.p1  ORF type:complete len:113 (-),score=12.56 GHVU01222797.1:44-382(-)